MYKRQPLGRAVGIKLFSDGVVVTGLSDVESSGGTVSPGRTGGLRAGDVITHINGQEVNTIAVSYTHLLDDPCSAFALSKVQTIPWCQCCAVFVPDGLTPQEALGYYRYHRRSFQRQLLDRACQASACTTEDDVTAAWEQKKTALVLTVERCV